MSDFANVLRRLRDSRGITQEEFASNVGLSRSAVSMYESGARTPDYDVLECIADFFNVDIDYLIGRTDKTTYIPETYRADMLNEREKGKRFIMNLAAIDENLLERMLIAGGKLPKENLEAFILAMEAAAAVCEKKGGHSDV